MECHGVQGMVTLVGFACTDLSDVCMPPTEGNLSVVTASTTPGTSPRGSDCRSLAACMSNVIVKNSFIDLDDEPSLHFRFRQLRRCKSDTSLQLSTKAVVYEPGKFIDNVQAAFLQQELVVISPPSRREARTGDERTTVMVKNIPNNYTRDMVLDLFNEMGFAGLYDFAYVPFDFERKANLGYVFVNLVRGDVVPSFWKTFSNFSNWAIPSAKVASVKWSSPHQGLISHIERFRNSALMHKSVPEKYKPVFLVDGKRQPFPSPTKIKPPYAASFHRN